jgi:hypothetical protein
VTCCAAAALAVSLAAAPRSTAGAPAPAAVDVAGLAAADYDRIIADEAYWVSTAQLACAGDGAGAIAEAAAGGTGRVSVHPYEANLGARALLLAGDRYVPMVVAYLRWYLGHLNAPDVHGLSGTVYDYDYDPSTCRGTAQPDPVTGEVPKYDSTDAYAGTFLTLVAEYARTDPAGSAWLGSPAVRAGLDAVADAVVATRMPSGLTGATPTRPAEYLLDNVEAARGLADYGWLLDAVLADPVGAGQRSAAAAAIRAAIESVLWERSRTPGMYGWAADRLGPSWNFWYPDSVAQLWPVFDGLGTPQRRAGLWAAFTARWPGWTASTPAYGKVSVDHDPDASVAYAAGRIGDKPALDDYLVRSATTWGGRPPPWTVDDSGFRAMAAAAGRDLAGGR